MKVLKININQIIGANNYIELQSILVITIMLYAFNTGLASLTEDQLSFIFPKYIEYIINNKIHINLLEMILLAVPIIFLAPIIEEFFFRGLVLQKWGIKTSIIASSLFFAFIHLRSDIIPLFIAGFIFSISYVKTHNLTSSIICLFFIILWLQFIV